MKEEFAELKTVRPGRTLFVRKLVFESSAATATRVNLVILHGTCATEAQFQYLMNALNQHYENSEAPPNVSIQCWLYDAVGCGQSPAPKEWDAYENQEQAQDLQSILSNLVGAAVDSVPCILMAHSYAPTIILEMLNRYPVENLNLAGCIMIGSAVRSEEGPPLMDGGHPIMKLPVFILNCLQSKLTDSFIEMSIYSDTALKELCRTGSNSNDMATAKAIHGHHKWATIEDLAVLKEVPVLVIHGTEDGVISPKGSEVIAKGAPKSKALFIEQASHLVQMEKPKEVAQAVMDFLTENVSK